MVQIGLLMVAAGALIMGIPLLLPGGLKYQKATRNQPAKYFKGPAAIVLGVLMIAIALGVAYYALVEVPRWTNF